MSESRNSQSERQTPFQKSGQIPHAQSAQPGARTSGTHQTRGARQRRRRLDGFDFTRAMRTVVNDICTRLPELQHVDMSRVAISFSQTRTSSQYGMFASLTPLRFADGKISTIRNGRKWTMQRVRDENGREMLYILSFYMPRFQNMTFIEKLTTIVHELFHIGPEFDGDLRRFDGRCYAHTGSQKKYDAVMEQLGRKWLALGPDPSIYQFLQYDFPGLSQHFGQVVGTKITTPKLYRVD